VVISGNFDFGLRIAEFGLMSELIILNPKSKIKKKLVEFGLMSELIILNPKSKIKNPKSEEENQ